ncbi:MAG: DUF1543 domain-containing protein [Flavobacterium sp.]|nr:DUF1543 domain-containing protein [Flavobacterium sp.]
MEKELKLYMIMLGCVPEGRFTEQHDIFFGIGKSLKELIPHINRFWPEAKGKIHIDAWREVSVVDDFSIEIVPKNTEAQVTPEQLFFINLGGYKENEFEEYHYKMITVASSLALASKKSKKTAFYKHCGFKEAPSHIDDQYGIDVDDIYNVADMLPAQFKALY